MLSVITLLIVAAVLVLDYFIADEFRNIAAKKGFCGRKYFWWSFFLGIVGYLMVVALPDRCYFRAEEAAPAEHIPTDCR